MRNSLVMIVLVAVMLGVGASVMAGEIDPGLENILKSAGPEQVISVLIYLDDQVNLYAITGEMDNRDTSLRRYHEVVVRALQEKVLTTQGDIVAFLSELKGEGKVKGFETYWITNAIRAEAVKEAVEKIAARADVAKVYYNYEAELVEPVEIMGDTRGGISSVENGVEAIRAPEVWALGIDGRGVLVANIDTGVDGHHPALAGRWAGVADPRYAGNPEWAWFDPYSNQNDFPFDQNGHGTHTMGTLTGGRSCGWGYDRRGSRIILDCICPAQQRRHYSGDNRRHHPLYAMDDRS